MNKGENKNNIKEEKRHSFLLIGHRGGRIGVAENTEHAFTRAVEKGFTYIEFDVRLTKDNKVIVFHDKTLSRVYNRACNKDTILSLIEKEGIKGEEEFLSTEISEYSYESFLSKIFITSYCKKIPLFEDIIKKFASRISFMIEIKDPLALPYVIEMLKENREEKRDGKHRTCISSNDPDILVQVKEALPFVETCLNITHCPKFPLNRFLKIKNKKELPLPFTMISLSISRLSRKFIEKCIELEIIPLTWNILSKRLHLWKAKRMIKAGLGGILLDNPENIRYFVHD